MNDLEKVLYRSRKTILQALEEVEDENLEVENLDQCSSCSIWLKITQLKSDLDGLPICNECWLVYGD